MIQPLTNTLTQTQSPSLLALKLIHTLFQMTQESSEVSQGHCSLFPNYSNCRVLPPSLPPSLLSSCLALHLCALSHSFSMACTHSTFLASLVTISLSSVMRHASCPDPHVFMTHLFLLFILSFSPPLSISALMSSIPLSLFLLSDSISLIKID